MRRSIAGSIAAAMLVAACSKEQKPATPDTSAAKSASATATKLGETSGVLTPESVRYDPELDVYYISNINGNPSQKDNNRFIAVARADSISAPLKMLVVSGRNGATLNAPKGLALVGDTLWVA